MEQSDIIIVLCATLAILGWGVSTLVASAYANGTFKVKSPDDCFWVLTLRLLSVQVHHEKNHGISYYSETYGRFMKKKELRQFRTRLIRRIPDVFWLTVLAVWVVTVVQ